MTTTQAGEATMAELEVQHVRSKNVFNHVACVWYLIESGSLELRGAPHNRDRERATKLARLAGLVVSDHGGTLRVSGAPHPTDLDNEVCDTRISICQAITIAARTGRSVLRPGGGCGFASRPIGLHLDIVTSTGGHVRELGDGRLEIIYTQAPRAASLHVISPEGVASVGASASALLVAMLAEGTTTIAGLNDGPEIAHLVQVLRAFGATVNVRHGTAEVVRPQGGFHRHVDFSVPLDQTAVGTYGLMGLARWGRVALRGAVPEDLPPALHRSLREAGVDVSSDHGALRLSVRESGLRGTTISTGTGSAFPTDLAPSWSAFMSVADGRSQVVENVYERRNSHIEGMRSAGVDVAEGLDGTYCVAPGLSPESQVTLHVRDIRCGDAFMVLAAARPGGVKLVDSGRHLSRGHPDLGTVLKMFDIDLSEESHV